MRYFKTTKNGIIYTIGKGELATGEEITEGEYNEILAVIKSCPHRQGYGYRLMDDLTWEEYELPPVTEEDPSSDEALSILLGGDEK